MIWDTFMLNDELDILECRLTELEDVPNLIHVIAESDQRHSDGASKPCHFLLNQSRFSKWMDRIVSVRYKPPEYVVLHSGKTVNTSDSAPWPREFSQRDAVFAALNYIDKKVAPTDIILHGDVDEIPTVESLRNLNPERFCVFKQRAHAFAVDWLDPQPWYGTVAAPYFRIMSFRRMADERHKWTQIPVIENGGWHLTWLGGIDAISRKLDCTPHTECVEWMKPNLEKYWKQGEWHPESPLIPVEIDATWPKWIRDGKAPSNWFRPRN